MSLQELRGLHVGRDHAFLDEPMAHRSRNDLDTIDFAVVIQLEFGLRQVDLDSTAAVRALWRMHDTGREAPGLSPVALWALMSSTGLQGSH